MPLSLFWVVTGIQFWITKYLTQVIGADPTRVTIVFSVVSIMAPVSGVFFGSWIIDRNGGYKGEAAEGEEPMLSDPQQVTALELLLKFGLAAAVPGIAAAYVGDFTLIIILIFFLLFMGGAIVPARRSHTRTHTRATRAATTHLRASALPLRALRPSAAASVFASPP